MDFSQWLIIIGLVIMLTGPVRGGDPNLQEDPAVDLFTVAAPLLPTIGTTSTGSAVPLAKSVLGIAVEFSCTPALSGGATLKITPLYNVTSPNSAGYPLPLSPTNEVSIANASKGVIWFDPKPGFTSAQFLFTASSTTTCDAQARPR